MVLHRTSECYEKLRGSVDDGWEDIINSVLKKHIAVQENVSSDCSGNIITEKEKQALISILNHVKDSDKWILSTKKVIEDALKEIIANSVFELPAHSFILNLSDPLSKKHFTKEAFKIKNFKSIPKILQEYMDSYDELETAGETRKYAITHYLNNEQFDKKWA